jgi:peptidoglycan hydrolase-like protein with peptidoglycan-binding domain
VQARLNNLGYHCGPVEASSAPRTKRALRDFQRLVLGRDKADGNLDSDTRSALEQNHEC